MQTERSTAPHVRDDQEPWTPRPTLAGSDYTCWEVYDEERERIWWGDWVCVGRRRGRAEPGDYVVRDLAGESIFVTRNETASCAGSTTCAATAGTKFVDGPGGPATRRRPSSARTTRGATT